MTAAITLDMLRAASSDEFPVIDLGPYMRGEAGALARVADAVSPCARKHRVSDRRQSR